MTMLQRPLKPGDQVFLVDGSNFIFRAYFQSMNQDRKYNYRSDGLPSGAVRLFANKMLQIVRDGVLGVRATHLAIIFDKSENSFRKELYPAYKANRSAPPADLIPQFPLMREVVRAFGLTPIEQHTYEADDLIATYARQAAAAGARVVIVSADKDLMQLIGPSVTMYDPASGDAGKKGAREERDIGVDEVIAYFGVPPEKVVDVQALAGDSTDNVPGAPGIGVKTAAQLILEYGDLDTLLARAGEIKQPKRRETLTNPEVVEKIRISRQLVALVEDAPLDFALEGAGVGEPDAATLIGFLKAMEFTTLQKRAAEVFNVNPDGVAADADLAPGGARAAELLARYRAEAGDAALIPAAPARAPKTTAAPSGPAIPGDLAAARAAAAVSTAAPAPEIITTPAMLATWLTAIADAGRVSLALQLTGIDPMQADIAGVGVAVGQSTGYIPLAHRAAGGDLFGGGELLPDQLDAGATLKAIAAAAAASGALIVGHGLKPAVTALAERGVTLPACDDVMLMSYVLDAGRAGHGLADLAQRFLGAALPALAEVTGTGRNALTFDRASIETAAPYAAAQAGATLALWSVLKPRLAAEGMRTVYETLERGMPATLSAMERRGVAIDRQMLSRLSGEFGQSLARLEHEIHELAGENFNVGSPKQLGDILFGKLGLPAPKKTATGAFTTGAQVLEDLAEQGHALPARVLEWRQLAKLKSNYSDQLPTFIHPHTHRVHTNYALAATTTGRLSSNEPNLQNIPVRTAEGRKIRTAFIAPPGTKLLSADYSQIELRLLAHIADIPQLTAAFANGDDIHAMTASEMFGVPVAGMPAEVRRRAKAINFGIIYGISAFGLANQLGIPREEAGAYIKKYFERFPGIRDYMEATKAACRADGYVSTIFGRKMHYPAITSKNPAERANMERAAINAPIQGAAADIIRRAMLRMDAALAKAGLGAKMLLQVHDELVFEVAESEVEATIPVVRKVMVEAPLPALTLRVPLQVDARAAANWDEAH